MKKRRKRMLLTTAILVLVVVIISLNIPKGNKSSNKVDVILFGETITKELTSKKQFNSLIEDATKNYTSDLENVTSTTFEVLINGQVENDYESFDYNKVKNIEINAYETTENIEVEFIAKSNTQKYDQSVETKYINTYKNAKLEQTTNEIYKVTNLVDSDKSYGTKERSIYIDDPSAVTAVVNKNRMLESTYVPNDLVGITVTSTKSGSNNMIRSAVLPNLEAMFAAAEGDSIKLTVTSAYRSYSTQTSLFNGYINSHGLDAALKFSAPPGASEHQTGLSLDIGEVNGTYDNFSTDFGKGKAGKWLANNAHLYGFVLRYPNGKESVTTYQYEPWHFRYVGVEEASKIYESGLTLEEYYELD